MKVEQKFSVHFVVKLRGSGSRTATNFGDIVGEEANKKGDLNWREAWRTPRRPYRTCLRCTGPLFCVLFNHEGENN